MIANTKQLSVTCMVSVSNLALGSVSGAYALEVRVRVWEESVAAASEIRIPLENFTVAPGFEQMWIFARH